MAPITNTPVTNNNFTKNVKIPDHVRDDNSPQYTNNQYTSNKKYYEKEEEKLKDKCARRKPPNTVTHQYPDAEIM